MLMLEEPSFSCQEKIARRVNAVAQQVSGRHSGGETPVPIPNTAVKPSSADGTKPEGGMGE